MKATCERDKLLHAFQMAASVAPSRSPKPILQNVKLEVSMEGAILMGTDLEVGVRVEVAGFSVEAPGSVVLPRDRFGKILSESSDEKLDLESDGGKVLVRGQRSEFQLPSEKPDEFPSVLAFEEKKYHEMPARFFREVIRRTAYPPRNQINPYSLPLLRGGDPATGLRRGQRNQPLCAGRRAGRADGQRADGRGHRRPTHGPTGR